MKVGESAIVPILHNPHAAELYRDLLTATRGISEETPRGYDEGEAEAVGRAALTLVAERPIDAVEVICALLLALAAADRTIAIVEGRAVE